MSGPTVSVVMPNYNGARYLREAVDSVLAQTYKDFELIIVDDGSTDDSPKILAGYGGSIRFYRQKNSGVAVARNRGIAESRGKYVAFIDSDDVWMPGKLAAQVPLFDEPKVGLVYCGCIYTDPDLKPKERFEPTLRGKVQHVMDFGPVATFRAPSTVMVRRTVFDEVGGFDKDLAILADWDMWRRIVSRVEVDVVPQPLIHYRVHPAGITKWTWKLEQEIPIVLANIFSDLRSPRRVFETRAEITSRWYLMLSGEFLHGRKLARSLRYSAKSVLVWPKSLRYILRYPLRAWSR